MIYNNRFFKALFRENIVMSKFTKCGVCGEMVFTNSNQKNFNFKDIVATVCKIQVEESLKLCKYG